MSAKAFLRNTAIPELKQIAPYFSMNEVRQLVKERGIKITDGTLRHYMSEAMANGVVHNAGKGWYSRIETPCELDPKPVARIIKQLLKEFPLLDFTCWSTQQVNPWMHHLLAKFITFVQVDRDGIQAVSDALRDAHYEVYTHPNAARAGEVRPGDRAVVIRPLNATAPTNGHFSPPEAVLVDLFAETKALSLMSPGEFTDMAQRMASSSRIGLGSLLLYAGKRKINGDSIFSDFGSLT